MDEIKVVGEKKVKKQSSGELLPEARHRWMEPRSRVTVKIYTMYKVKNGRKMALQVASQ